jgi:hypothetical protein
MCRNIKTLFNFDPPVTDEEIRAASLQFVRKITGFNKPSKSNEAAFLAAIDEIAGISARLLYGLDTNAPPKNREEEAARAKARAAERFGAWRRSFSGLRGSAGFCVQHGVHSIMIHLRLEIIKLRFRHPVLSCVIPT